MDIIGNMRDQKEPKTLSFNCYSLLLYAASGNIK